MSVPLWFYTKTVLWYNQRKYLLETQIQTSVYFQQQKQHNKEELIH